MNDSGIIGELLRCARCLSQGSLAADGWRCAACGARAPRDERGILTFAEHDAGWQGVPQAVAAAVRAASDEADLRQRLHAVIPAPNVRDNFWWHLRAQNQMPLALFAPAVHGGRALLLGAPWPGLIQGLQRLDYRVVLADTCYARLNAARVLSEPKPLGAVHLQTDRALPFGTDAFDLVVCDSEAVLQTPGRDAWSDARAAARILMPELRRVLGPRGRALVAAAGQRIAGWRPLFRALVTGRLGRHVQRRAAAAGFGDLQIWLPDHSRLSWRQLTPETSEGAPLGRPGPSLARRLGIPRSRDYFLMAGKRASRETLPGESIAAAVLGAEASASFTIVALSGERAGLLDENRFVKFPFSEAAEDRVRVEVDAMRRARQSAFGPAIAGEARLERWRDHSLAVSARVEADPQADAGTRAGALAAFLPTLPGEMAPLSSTVHWELLHEPAARARVVAFGAEGLFDHITENLGAARVMRGPTHGDLGLQNVLIDRLGKLRIIDWDQGFSERGAMAVDAIQAADSYAGEVLGLGLDVTLHALAAGELEHPFSGHLERARGELSACEALALALLARLCGPNALPASEAAAAHLRAIAQTLWEEIADEPSSGGGRLGAA